MHTGARGGEQLAFEWGDIDWHSHLMLFRRSSTHGVVGPTKSGRERKVPLSATLEAALKGIDMTMRYSHLAPGGNADLIRVLDDVAVGADGKVTAK